MSSKYLFLIFVLIITACEKVFFKDDPENNAKSNFDIFWNDFDKYYAQFGIRNFDWDSVYSVNQSKITSTTTDKELFKILSEIVVKLDDGHVNLFTPTGNASWKGKGRGIYPSSNLTDQKLKLSLKYKYSLFGYASIVGHNIGYVQIYTFVGSGDGINLNDERYFFIDQIIEEFKDKDGIIIDVRANGGGNSLNAENIAGRFTSEKMPYCRVKKKNGVGKDNFTDWLKWYIEPKGPVQYSKPVVVLTSRHTFSSAECFVMAMKVNPQVTTVGDTTGGGTANPLFRELPNGWAYRLSTLYTITNDDRIVDGRGIVPDVPILTTYQDSIYLRDRILEKGIEVIEKQ